MNSQKLDADIQRAIEESVQKLAASQKPNGQFVGLASPNPNDFSEANQHQTTFFTSLIIMSLESVSDTSDVKAKAAQFILNERSPAWSWNYWLRDCTDYKLRPYPDDLDDTACALTALFLADKTTISQDCLANFAKQLISQESKPGGPYSTWLIASPDNEIWKDIDIAVNANIGNFLESQDIVLAGMEKYVSGKIMSNSLLSKYYLGDIPVIYFLTRWYHGPAILQLRIRVEELLINFSELNDLHLSMLLTSAINLKSPVCLEPMILDLLERKSDKGWAANALYYEPAINGIKFYAGSIDLTMAMACEALQKYFNSATSKSESQVVSPPVDDNLIKKTDSIAQDFKTRYQDYLDSISNRDTKGQITKIATLTAQSLKRTLDQELIVNLNLASLNGWASYTLFDDFLDGEGLPDKLPMAMLGLRRTGGHFRKALPGDQKFASHIEATLDIVDNANSWELAKCRLPISTTVINLSDLPNFADLSQLAHKSWGHTIASTGIMLAAGYPLNSQPQADLQRFFYHYLIARQLNDDAHDWQADLDNRQLSFVVTKLVRGHLNSTKTNAIKLEAKPGALQTHFWEYTIVEVIDLINQNLKLARNALDICQPLKDRTILGAWLNDIQVATDKGANSRTEAQSFIESFSA